MAICKVYNYDGTKEIGAFDNSASVVIIGDYDGGIKSADQTTTIVALPMLQGLATSASGTLKYPSSTTAVTVTETSVYAKRNTMDFSFGTGVHTLATEDTIVRNNLKITVASDINNQDKTVTPTTSKQSITADAGYSGLGTVTVNAVTAAIDPNIKSGNIKSGITILGVSGSSKVLDTTDGTAKSSDVLSGKTAYVNGAKITGEIPDAEPITGFTKDTQGVYTPVKGDTFLITGGSYVRGDIQVNGIPANFADTTGATNFTAGQLLTGQKGVNGKGTLITGSMPNNGDVSGTISTKTGTVAVPAGYTTGGTVAIASTEQAKIVSGNIKSGVTILGVAGKKEVIDTTEATSAASANHILTGKVAFVNGVKITGKIATVVPSKTALSTKTDTSTVPVGYIANAATIGIASSEQAKIVAGNIKSGITILGVSGTFTSDADATDGNILSGKTAYVNGVKVTGTIPTLQKTGTGDFTVKTTFTYDESTGRYTANSKSSITGDTAAFLIPGGTYVDTDLAINPIPSTWFYTGDADAVAGNILSGKTAYIGSGKVTGTMTNNGAVAGTISTKAGTYTVPAGYHNGSGKVQISSTEQAKLISSNIKSGVTILGVAGSSVVVDTTIAANVAAVANSIELGKQAYVNGVLITGTLKVYKGETV